LNIEYLILDNICYNFVIDMAEYAGYCKYFIKRGHSLTAMTRLWHFLTTYLPWVTICEEILLILFWKICIPLTFPVLSTYLILSTYFLNAPKKKEEKNLEKNLEKNDGKKISNYEFL
jgi:hypothetical protein